MGTVGPIGDWAILTRFLGEDPVSAPDRGAFPAVHEVGAQPQRCLKPSSRWPARSGPSLAPPAGWRARARRGRRVVVEDWPEAFTGDGAYPAAPGPDLAGLTVNDGSAATVTWLEEREMGSVVAPL